MQLLFHHLDTLANNQYDQIVRLFNNLWPFTIMEKIPMLYLNFAQNRNKHSQNVFKFHNYVQQAKFGQIWSHWNNLTNHIITASLSAPSFPSKTALYIFEKSLNFSLFCRVWIFRPKRLNLSDQVWPRWLDYFLIFGH